MSSRDLERLQRIVLTRTAEQCRPWRTALESAGLRTLTLPLLRFSLLDPPGDLDPQGYDYVLFTSPQGVASFFDAGLETGAARVGVLGDGTAGTLAACGGTDHLGLRARDGAGLARAFTAAHDGPADILLPGPERRLEEPKTTLEAAGFAVTVLPLYRTDAVPAAELPAEPFRPDDLIFFASPSAVRAFVAAWGVRPRCVAIGETTAQAAREADFETAVADAPDLSAMVRAAGLGVELSTHPEPESPNACKESS